MAENLTIELQKMRMTMAHADAASMTKCSEVKSRAKRITDDAGQNREGSPYLRAYSCQNGQGGEDCVRGTSSV